MTEISVEKAFRPIFVVGNSRSGTTLMGTVLGRHAAVFRFEELHFFEELWSATDSEESCSEEEAIALIAKLFDIQRNGYLTRGDWQDFLEEAKNLVNSLTPQLSPAKAFQAFLDYETQLQNKTRACDQTPQNILYIKEILTHYPNASIVHMVRDPRAILLSQKNRWRRPFLSDSIPKKEAVRYWLNYHPITMSQLWKANVQTVDGFIEDERVYTLRYEDLLNSPEEAVEKVCEFAGITFSPEMLKVPQVNSSSQKDQPKREGINKDRADSWKKGGLTATEMFLCQRINQTLMDIHGYAAAPLSPNPLMVAISVLLFPIKLSLAILFSLKRMKNLGEAIKRRLK
ncbi:MAG: sulfotransferase [Phormidesmis sp.]